MDQRCTRLLPTPWCSYRKNTFLGNTIPYRRGKIRCFSPICDALATSVYYLLPIYIAKNSRENFRCTLKNRENSESLAQQIFPRLRHSGKVWRIDSFRAFWQKKVWRITNDSPNFAAIRPITTTPVLLDCNWLTNLRTIIIINISAV